MGKKGRFRYTSGGKGGYVLSLSRDVNPGDHEKYFC